MSFLRSLFVPSKQEKLYRSGLTDLLGFKPGNLDLYIRSMSHRSMREPADENNERLEYLGDAILSAIIANYLFKRYPKRGEGFLTEMRSKMVNRQTLNDIALKLGIKKLTHFNKIDNSLKNSQIFGNTLEALVGAIYLDKGYSKAERWVTQQIIMPFFNLDELEALDINVKNRIIGWANKNNKNIEFETLEEKLEKGRRLFVIGVVLDGKRIAAGRGFNKKDASHLAALQAAEVLGI